MNGDGARHADGGNQSLSDELEAVGDSRVNALPSIVGERCAALRYRLDRVNENHCDAYTTDDTPGYPPDVPIEVKSVRVDHHDMTGRIGVHPRTHWKLSQHGGDYCIVLYGEADVGGRRIVVIDTCLVPGETVGRYLSGDSDGYQKVRWDNLLTTDVDRDRWSR